MLAFLVKIGVFIFLQLQVRWTLPRFRYDQIMQLCWKLILPLSLANILVTGRRDPADPAEAALIAWRTRFSKPKRTLGEQAYFPEAAKGLALTISRFFKNTFSKEENKVIATIRYPDEVRDYPERFRACTA